MSPPEIRENVFGRCGQAVSRLRERAHPRRRCRRASEVHEWWLVSPDLAAKLRARAQPVCSSAAPHVGPRSGGTALEDDEH
jgi:hypothetical protein